MSLKGDYAGLDEVNPFDLESLTPGKEIYVKVVHLNERTINSKDGTIPVAELECELVWAEDEKNSEFIGNSFKYPIFLGKTSENNIRILRDALRRNGFQVSGWVKDSDTPLSIMLPSAIKLLALRNTIIGGKVTRSGNATGTRNFFNFAKIVRVNPEGYEYEGALPAVIPDTLVLEAYHAELPGGNEDSTGGEIPV